MDRLPQLFVCLGRGKTSPKTCPRSGSPRRPFRVSPGTDDHHNNRPIASEVQPRRSSRSRFPPGNHARRPSTRPLKPPRLTRLLRAHRSMSSRSALAEDRRLSPPGLRQSRSDLPMPRSSDRQFLYPARCISRALRERFAGVGADTSITRVWPRGAPATTWLGGLSRSTKAVADAVSQWGPRSNEPFSPHRPPLPMARGAVPADPRSGRPLDEPARTCVSSGRRGLSCFKTRSRGRRVAPCCRRGSGLPEMKTGASQF